jgi:hypothetical protein
MPNVGGINVEGSVLSNSSISNTVVSNGGSSNAGSKSNVYIGQTNNVFEDGSISIDSKTSSPYIQSLINTGTINNQIYPDDRSKKSTPFIGEWVQLAVSYDPFSLANNPSNPIPIVTYTYVKNIWNNPFNNINVDSTTQGQAEQTKMTSVNVKNMSNSIAGFV